MKILGIESSCDETAAAVIEDGRKICSSVIHTQVEEHKLYGAVPCGWRRCTWTSMPAILFIMSPA